MLELEEVIDSIDLIQSSKLKRLDNESNSSCAQSNSLRKKAANCAPSPYQDEIDPCKYLLSGDGLRFQLKLNSLGDLHRLLSTQLLIEGIAPPDFSALIQPHYSANHPCTLFRTHFLPEPIKDKVFSPPNKPFGLRRRLADYLFSVYLSDCFTWMQHPDRSSLLEQYYRNELEPALVYTALAFSAVHVLLTHTQAPMLNQLRGVTGELLAKARSCLEDDFDSVTPHGVLAFINMETCLRALSQLTDAYGYYKQAALMGLSLEMDKDYPAEVDAVQKEFRKRIWWCVCKREVWYVHALGKPSLIPLETMRTSPIPTVMPNDSVKYRIALFLFEQEVLLCTKIAGVREIDWSLPDPTIVQNIVSVATFLQRHQVMLMQQCRKGNPHSEFVIEVDCSYWISWCNLWQPFLVSNAPPGRLDTNLMQQLKTLALEGYVKGLTEMTLLFQNNICKQSWCSFCPHLHVHLICEMHKFIVHVHPDRLIRIKCFRLLAQTLQLMRRHSGIGKLIENRIANEIVDTLEKIKPMVFSKEELEAKRLKPIVIRKP
ncbi:uncharacterized protein VTP21DRAFT_5654 [Calcarisporiella thermophila]|uniref:uncharacterized protein n=1 Tax=Calcarisporiella thermophila TaxID=911321 RepID=UPI003744520E